jgi:hypothetical protein
LGSYAQPKKLLLVKNQNSTIAWDCWEPKRKFRQLSLPKLCPTLYGSAYVMMPLREGIENMRKLLWMIPALFLALGALPAHADELSYEINFTCDSTTPSCLLPTSGTFTYNTTTDSFTSFLVDWDGITTNLAAAANAGPTIDEGTNPCIGAATGGAASYLLMTACPFDLYEPWLANSGGTFAFTESTNGNNYESFRATIPGLPGDTPQAYGDFTLTETPEPATYVFMLTGIGLVLVMRKRIALKS